MSDTVDPRIAGYAAMSDSALRDAERDVEYCLENPDKDTRITPAESRECLALIKAEIARRAARTHRLNVVTRAILNAQWDHPTIHVNAQGHVVEDLGDTARVYFPEYRCSLNVHWDHLDRVTNGISVGTRTTSEAELVYGEFIETDDDGSGVIVTDSGTFPVLADTVMPVTTESRYTTEELTSIVDLWERLCAITTGETRGEYLCSTRYLSPESKDRDYGNTTRMPDATEIRALVLSNGAEIEYPKHGEFEDGERMENRSPYSYGDQLYPITLTLISCGDYHGSDVDSANNRALDQNYVGVDVRYPNTGGMCSIESVSTVELGCMSVFGDSEREEIENLQALVEALEGLTDYPLLDEDIHSQYVSTLTEDAWDRYLSLDIESDLVALCPNRIDYPITDRSLSPHAIENAHELVAALWEASGEHAANDTRGLDVSDAFRLAYYEYDGNEWTCEAATSVVNGRHDEAVRHAAHVVFGWGTCDCYTCTNAENADES